MLGFMTLRSVLESTRRTVLSFGKDAELVNGSFCRRRRENIVEPCWCRHVFLWSVCVCVFGGASKNVPFDESWH